MMLMSVTWYAVGIKAVFYKLRASIAFELTHKPYPCLYAAASYIYRAYNVLPIVMLLLLSVWYPRFVLAV